MPKQIPNAKTPATKATPSGATSVGVKLDGILQALKSDTTANS